MTARLELAEAIGNRMNEWGENPLTPSYWADLLDDLPADVLARYAIERGGLEGHALETWWEAPDDYITVTDWLYRVVKP